MKLRNAVFTLLASAVGFAAWADGGQAVSTTSVVDMAVSALRWKSLHEKSPTLRWAYPAGAASATVAVTNMFGREVFRQMFSAPVKSCVWTVFEGDAPVADDMFTAVVSFDSGDSLVAQIALLKSSFGAGARVLPENDRRWTRVGDAALIPYDASWLGSETAEFAISRRDGGKSDSLVDADTGWYPWCARGWDYGWFDLSLSSGEEFLSAQLQRIPQGVIFSIK